MEEVRLLAGTRLRVRSGNHRSLSRAHSDGLIFKLGDALSEGERPTDFHRASCGPEINDFGAVVPTDSIFAVT